MIKKKTLAKQKKSLKINRLNKTLVHPLGGVCSLNGAQYKLSYSNINSSATVSEFYNQLNWLPPTSALFPILGYHVYRNETLIATLLPAQLSFQDHYLLDSVIYLYAVAAFNINGEGPRITIAIP